MFFLNCFDNLKWISWWKVSMELVKKYLEENEYIWIKEWNLIIIYVNNWYLFVDEFEICFGYV